MRTIISNGHVVEKFTREYLHEQLDQLREAFSTEEFWDKPGAVENAMKAVWFTYFQTESPNDFDKLRVEATLDELKKRWEYIRTPRNAYDRNELLTRAYLDGRNALHAGNLRLPPPELDDLEKINWECGYDDAWHEQEDDEEEMR